MTQGQYPRSASALLPFLFATACLGAGLGLRDPSPPDEPRFALAARDMVSSGEWLVPHRGREYYAEKPPVFMWLIAASQTLVQNWRVAFLLPSLLAAMGTLWLTWDLAARLWTRRMAPYAAGALWVCLQFGLQAKRAQIDMVLVFFTTLSLWGILRHLLRGPAWRSLWLGAFAAGVGTVTKGVGFLPLLVMLPWLLISRMTPTAAPPEAAAPWRWALVAVAFVAGTSVWLGPLLVTLMRNGDPALQAYVSELLLKQTGQRYVSAWHHVQPAWYYAKVIATLWLPGALLLPWLLPGWLRRLRRGDSRQILLLAWSALVLLFFSASPGKREIYVFPVLPAMCLAAAPLLPGLLRQRGVRRVLLAYLLIVASVVLAFGAAGLLGENPWAQRLIEQRAIDTRASVAILWWMVALGLAGLALAAWGRLQHTAAALVLFTGALWAIYGLGFAPALNATSSARALMQKVGARIGPDAELGMLAWQEQNLLQADRPVAEFGFRQPWHEQWREAHDWLLAAPERRWLFVRDEALSPCVRPNEAVLVGRANRRTWVLVPGTSIERGCSTPAFDSEPPGPP